MNSPIIELRPWCGAYFEPFAAMNADPAVMEFFPQRLTIDESREMFQRLHRGIEQRGWGLWAVTVGGEFAGFTGLAEPRFTAAFTPCVEIGWRFRREFWGRGLAYRAARQAETFAFARLQLKELVSFTAAINLRSRRLMERLGFARNPAEDFQHPTIAADSPIRPHVLYRKSAEAWRVAPSSSAAS